jgi:hypothetical protein
VGEVWTRRRAWLAFEREAGGLIALLRGLDQRQQGTAILRRSGRELVVRPFSYQRLILNGPLTSRD